jgi:hypothetical protein
MTVTDCRVVFSLQKQIIKAPELSAERKLEMIEASIDETLGIEKNDKE